MSECWVSELEWVSEEWVSEEWVSEWVSKSVNEWVLSKWVRVSEWGVS